MKKIICTPHAPLWAMPHGDANMTSQLVYGEPFEIAKEDNDYFFGTSLLDGYTGWLLKEHVTNAVQTPTHRVSVPLTFVYPQADIKTKPMGALSLGARCVLEIGEAPWASLNFFCDRPIVQRRFFKKGYVWASHLRSLIAPIEDYVTLAENLLHMPYLWGGRGYQGIDCSGLVQLVLQMAGIFWPRDTCDQVIGADPYFYTHCSPQRGDIIFWNGHVGILRSEAELLHASGGPMMVMSEPFAAYQKQHQSSFLGVRRPRI